MKIIAIVLIALLLSVALITISISQCSVITTGYFAGRTVCFFTTVNVQPGTTTIADVNIES